MIKLGLITDRHMVSFDCTLPASPELTWFYLTGPEGLHAWLADGVLQPRLCGNLKLRFQSDEILVRSNGGVLIRGVVKRYEPCRRLAYSWIDVSREADAAKTVHVVPSSTGSFQLAGEDTHTWLSLTHSDLPAHMLSKTGAGWHTHLNLLITSMRNEATKRETVVFPWLLPEYERQTTTLRMDASA